MAIASITPVTDSAQCKAGEATTYQFTVDNTSGGRLRIGAEVVVESADGLELTVAPPIERDLDDGASDTIAVSVSASADAEAGKRTFRLRVYRAHETSDSVDSPTVSVEVTREEVVVPDEPEEPKPTGIPWWVYAAIAGGVVLIIGIVVAVVMMGGPGKVPDVRGMPLEEALVALEDADLEVAGVTEESSGGDKEAGTVIDQKPEPDADIPDGKQIELVLEAVSVEVPSVVGITVADAEDVLIAAGLVKGQVTVADAQSRGPSPRVIQQTPVEGERALPGTQVHLSVEKQTISVPAMVGMPFGEATNLLRTAGLTWRINNTATGNTAPGTVLSHNPPANREVSAGARVVLNVETQTVSLPNVVGRNVKDATAILRRAGVKVRSVAHWAANRSLRASTVHSQSPRSGQRVAMNSTVTIVYQPQLAIGGRVSMTLSQQINAVQAGKLTLEARTREVPVLDDDGTELQLGAQPRLAAPDEDEGSDQE